MKLIFRLPIVILESRRGPRIDILDESAVDFSVLPNDCDLYFHMNNARYANIAVLGRVHHLGKVGLLKPLLKRRWFPIIFASDTIHTKPIRPFKRYTLKTRMLTWDEKYWYYEHIFETNGINHAVNMTMGVMICKRKILDLKEVAEELGLLQQPPEPPDRVMKWKELHKQLKMAHEKES